MMFVVLCMRGAEQRWVWLPTIETAQQSRDYWVSEGWTAYIGEYRRVESPSPPTA